MSSSHRIPAPAGPRLSRRTATRTALLAAAAPFVLGACEVRRETADEPSREENDPAANALKLVQSGARYAMATSLEHGSRTRWVTDGLKKQVRHLMKRTGGVTIDRKKVLEPSVNGDVSIALMASTDAMLPRLHEAGDQLTLATECVAWWIGAAHVVDPRCELPSLPNDCAEIAAEALGDLHEVTWAMQVLTTRLGPDVRSRSLRGIGHLQDVRRMVDTLAGDAGPDQEIAYRMPREVMDREDRADRFNAFLDPWAEHLRQQITEHADDPKAVHLLTALLGTAVGLQMDWNEHSTPSVPQGGGKG